MGPNSILAFFSFLWILPGVFSFQFFSPSHYYITSRYLVVLKIEQNAIDYKYERFRDRIIIFGRIYEEKIFDITINYFNKKIFILI